MLKFNENDEKLWLSIWPRGLIWTLMVMIFMAISEYFFRGNIAQYGKLFYALLIVPFAWHGYDWYAKFLLHRSMKRSFVQVVTTVYLVMISGSMVFVHAKEFNFHITLVLIAQSVVTIYLWARHFENICNYIQGNLFGLNEFRGRYFYDIGLFVFPVALVFMF